MIVPTTASNLQRTFVVYLVLVILLLSYISLFADSDKRVTNTKNDNKALFSIVYKKANSSIESYFEKLIRESPEVASVSSLINEELKLVEPLTLVFGEDDGPLFDGEKNQITIPYGFLEEVQTRFKQAKYQKDSGLKLDDLVIDALLHTLFHELAHAVIAQYDLPVLGKEEDAADGLASMFLIEYFTQGQEIVLTAADLFDLESQDIEVFEKQDFWDEHSLDIQRYYTSMCHVYGSAPKQYHQIKKEEQFSDEKAESCVDDYQILVNSWMTLLQPYLKAE